MRAKRRTPLRRRAWPRPRQKYGARSCVYDGRTFHSRKEANYAKQLDALKRAKDPRERVAEWRPQARIRLIVNGKHICDYYCDFYVVFADGRVEWHEVKGFETPEWRIKEKLFRALHPAAVLKVIR